LLWACDDCIIKVPDPISADAVQIKFEEELKRYNKFHRSVLGVSSSSTKHKDIDLKTYAKYILKEGSNGEKRDLMGCLESRVVVKQKVVRICP
jgi:predicted alternative tryptophan synthase beta-subunit